MATEETGRAGGTGGAQGAGRKIDPADTSLPLTPEVKATLEGEVAYNEHLEREELFDDRIDPADADSLYRPTVPRDMEVRVFTQKRTAAMTLTPAEEAMVLRRRQRMLRAAGAYDLLGMYVFALLAGETTEQVRRSIYATPGERAEREMYLIVAQAVAQLLRSVEGIGAPEEQWDRHRKQAGQGSGGGEGGANEE